MRFAGLALLLTGLANAAIIPVTGSGEFFRDFDGESSASIRFSGTDGAHSVSLSSEIYLPYASILVGAGGTGWSTLGSAARGYATVDGISSDLFSFGIGRGGGSVDIYKDRVSIAHADLSGYVRITQQTSTPFFGTSGEYVITSSNPEPSTFLLLVAGLGFLYGGNRLRGRRQDRLPAVE